MSSSSSSLSSYDSSETTLNGYYAMWDYPEESCMYKGSVSLIPSKPLTPLSPLEEQIRKYAVNLENGHQVLSTLVRLTEFRAPFALFRDYNIRKLANKHLYKMSSMDQVVKLAERIERMEQRERKKAEAVAAESSSTSSGSSPTGSNSSSSTASGSTNVFLSGAIDVSATLDRLLDYVNNK